MLTRRLVLRVESGRSARRAPRARRGEGTVGFNFAGMFAADREAVRNDGERRLGRLQRTADRAIRQPGRSMTGEMLRLRNRCFRGLRREQPVLVTGRKRGDDQQRRESARETETGERHRRMITQQQAIDSGATPALV